MRCLRLKDNDILISGGDRKRIIAWNVKVSLGRLLQVMCSLQASIDIVVFE